MLSALHVLGTYWHPVDDRPTRLGSLMRAAKDGTDPAAVDLLGDEMARFASGLGLAPTAVVVPVPPAPGRAAHPVPTLAARVAAGAGLGCEPLVTRAHHTPPVRDAAPVQRAALVAAAGYDVTGRVGTREVVLVDDVVLTGTTLGHVADLLVDAGASRVEAVVVCRTRRIG
jgi:predicted amidophosphoribosyltransferase